jgi:hypothetical protein
MAKISLGKKPKNFEYTVKFQQLDGTEGIIPVVFKYRTRQEFGAFIDDLNADRAAALFEAGEFVAGEAPAVPVKAAEFSMTQFMEETVGKNAKYILAVLDSWGLDIELSLESAQDLANTYPGGAAQLMESYRAAIQEGRLGN